ncbi:beta-ketoacyl-ACP synthase III [Phosphitispora sp. TUW77]|uniref:beta-ketoacyl-ACP synthase III n=1 Tax=Phosphitispora sp. TUW77 TaxID=3152361 RepID=UPI003AB8D955
MPVGNIPAGIAGTGICLPERVLTNQDLEKMVDTSDEWVRTRTGIIERRIIDETMATSDLAVRAGEMALENAGLTPDSVDLIIVATTTPDMYFPSTACLVQEKIGAVKAAAFDISAACTGFIYALAVGSQFIQTGMYKTVLIIGAEALSRAIDWQDRNTCVLFGDGAGAAVLRPAENGYGIGAIEMGADGGGSDLLKVSAIGSPDYRRPGDTGDKSDNRRSGRADYIQMSGPEVFKFAVRIMGECAAKAVAKAGLTERNINLFIPHQANIRIIRAAAKRLRLPEEKVYINVASYGNTSSASIPVALHEALLEGKIVKGDNIVLVGFGAGLTWGAAVIKWAV